MDVYKIYTNTGNHIARGSLLGDTVITKTPTTFGGRVFALDSLIPGTNCAENRERFLHCCARNDKFECYFDVLESNAPSNLMRILILNVIFG